MTKFWNIIIETEDNMTAYDLALDTEGIIQVISVKIIEPDKE